MRNQDPNVQSTLYAANGQLFSYDGDAMREQYDASKACFQEQCLER